MKRFLVVLVLMILLFAGCSDTGGSGSVYWELTAEKADFILPTDATNVQTLGNGWVQFDLGEDTFMFLYRKSGTGRAAAVTQVQ